MHYEWLWIVFSCLLAEAQIHTDARVLNYCPDQFKEIKHSDRHTWGQVGIPEPTDNKNLKFSLVILSSTYCGCVFVCFAYVLFVKQILSAFIHKNLILGLALELKMTIFSIISTNLKHQLSSSFKPNQHVSNFVIWRWGGRWLDSFISLSLIAFRLFSSRKTEESLQQRSS